MRASATRASAPDSAKKEWREEVTELLSVRDCSTPGTVDFYAFIGANHVSTTVEYSQ